jgi:glycogen debranching enzyme
MEDTVQIENRWYILAGSSLVDQRTLVLKHGDTFGAFTQSGDIEAFASKGQGLFHQGMRHLSRLETRLNGRRPLLLSSEVTTDNGALTVDLTNPDITADGAPAVPHGAIHLQRTRTMRGGAMFERITVASFDPRSQQSVLALTFEADYVDIFEVRGARRPHRGRRLEPELIDGRAVRLSYEGLDGVVRRTLLEFDPPPELLTVSLARYGLSLAAGERRELFVTVRCEPSEVRSPVTYRESCRDMSDEAEAATARTCRIVTTNQQLNRWLDRSLADVRMLTSDLNSGPYPFAGIPWYSCPFGRDGIITALQMIWVDPGLARGALAFLAEHQACERDADRDAEPGKILHEWRNDEMANCREVPFGRYYGTVDATPLFVMLAGAYFRATADVEFVARLWPHVERALEWMDEHGDEDGDGFVEYRCKATDGLSNQGWKDSHDSVFHADGSLAKPPIALCEVQGYVYEAKRFAAVMAQALGREEQADQLDAQAADLKARFHECFWRDDLGMYALALDADKVPCAVRTSNAAHCLWTRIADAATAPALARSLMSREMYSGWGIRTVGASEARFNPMAYHNGSVWPHDNAIAALGLSRYGFRHQPRMLLTTWMHASGFLDLHRLPELICGFRRRSGGGPTQYPVACSPQAWAAGSVFMLLEACLGLTVDAPRRLVRLVKPILPTSVRELQLTNLRVGAARVDLLLHRERDDVGVLVQRREGEVSVTVEK